VRPLEDIKAVPNLTSGLSSKGDLPAELGARRRTAGTGNSDKHLTNNVGRETGGKEVRERYEY